MAYRVAVWGPGNVGIPAIRTVVANPALELAAVIVHSAAKEGRDAGELAGLPATGVRATRDVAGVLAARPDALFYAANQDFRAGEAQDDMLRCLAAGVNVVTAGLFALMHPPSADAKLRERFDAACRRGGASFLASGIDPGWAHDLLPIALSGVCEEIREIRMVENFNYATYAVPAAVREIIGFGSPMQRTPPMLLPGVPRAVWGGVLHGLAAALSLEVESLREEIERHPLERDVTLADGTRLARGTQGAFRFEVQAVCGGRPVLVVEHVTRIADDTAPQWPRPAGMGHHQLRIRGRPDMLVTVESRDERGDHVAGGNLTAAARLVNAIPWVCQAPPGLLAGADAPLVAGRGLVRTA
jgi:hypothetical protein